jgi:large subunit ribosomal protein L35
LPIRATSAISPAFAARLNKGCRGDVCGFAPKGKQATPFQRSNEHFRPPQCASGRYLRGFQESQMPKLKTKSGAKKRFKITGTGKVVSAHAGKRHGMIKRTKKQIRQLRGTRIMFKTDGDNIKQYFLPND